MACGRIQRVDNEADPADQQNGLGNDAKLMGERTLAEWWQNLAEEDLDWAANFDVEKACDTETTTAQILAPDANEIEQHSLISLDSSNELINDLTTRRETDTQDSKNINIVNDIGIDPNKDIDTCKEAVPITSESYS